MNAPTDFEKRLIELNLTYAQIELVKQAVEEFLIPNPNVVKVDPVAVYIKGVKVAHIHAEWSLKNA